MSLIKIPPNYIPTPSHLSTDDGAAWIITQYRKFHAAIKPLCRATFDSHKGTVPCSNWPHVFDLGVSIFQARHALAGQLAEQIIIQGYHAIFGGFLQPELQQEPDPFKKTRSLDLVFNFAKGTLVCSVTTRPQERKNSAFPAEAEAALRHYSKRLIIGPTGKKTVQTRKVMFFGIFFDGGIEETAKHQGNLANDGIAIDCRDVAAHAKHLSNVLGSLH